MKWNYRVFKDEDGEFGVREVFYDEGDGTILGCTADTQKPYGKTLEELTLVLSWFQKALNLPVLSMTDIPESTGYSISAELEAFDSSFRVT